MQLEWHCIALLCWCAVKKLLTHSLACTSCSTCSGGVNAAGVIGMHVKISADDDWAAVDRETRKQRPASETGHPELIRGRIHTRM